MVNQLYDMAVDILRVVYRNRTGAMLSAAVFILVGRAFKDLFYTSSQQSNFFALWYKYGSPIFSVIEVSLNSGFLLFMFFGIYKVSKSKANKQQLDFISAKYNTAVVLLIIYVFFNGYFGCITAFISAIDTDDLFIHTFVLKLDVLLIQPMTFMICLYLKLYYLLLEIFAKKDVLRSGFSKHSNAVKSKQGASTKYLPNAQLTSVPVGTIKFS
ncbi:hypothetical protein HDV06_006552 [Boothiomyces sp. JEL0866]|nr:hypothetical protein HDV06_006552 [Boothiomyces sp. JEL0866]